MIQKTIVFDNNDSNWIDLSDKVKKNYSNTFHSSTKVIPIQLSIGRNQPIVKEELKDKRKEVITSIEESDSSNLFK